MDVTYEMKKKTHKITTTLPANFYDQLEKDLARIVTRVNLFQVSKNLGDKKLLQLRRLYIHKAKGNPKNWLNSFFVKIFLNPGKLKEGEIVKFIGL